MPKFNLDNECRFVTSEINRRQNPMGGVLKHELLLAIQASLCDIIKEKDKAKRHIREKIYLKTKNFYLANYC